MKKKLFEAIYQQIKASKTAFVAAHLDPDGDAIGSILALAVLLEKFKIETFIYLHDNLPRVYRFLPGVDKIKSAIPVQRRFDLAFVLDASENARIGNEVNLKQLADKVINIDHHPDNHLFGDINYVEKASCVGEQIYQLFKYGRIKIDLACAQCLYVALVTDTGNFRYENTTAATFKMAADLLAAGVNPSTITTLLYDTRTLATVKLFALALGNLKFNTNQKIAWAVVRKETLEEVGGKPENLIGLVDHIRSIEGVELALLFREEEGGKIKVNFRSKERINVSILAKNFGGGGHVRAAGATLYTSMESAVEKVVREAEQTTI